MAGWAAAAQAATELLGGLATNLHSAAQAKKARDFTKQMMKSRHQWEVKDLRKAGLNPILSAGGTPSMGSSAMAQTHPMGMDIEKAVETGIKAASAKDVVRKKKLEKETAVWAPYQAERGLHGTWLQNELLGAQKNYVEAQTSESSARRVHQELLNIGMAVEGDIDQTKFGRGARYIKRVTDQIPPIGLGALIQRGGKKSSRKTRQRTSTSKGRSTTYYDYE